MNYADRSRAQRQPQRATPRNMKAVQQARDQDLPLVISFVGDAPWSNPTVYCDGGQRYDWSFMEGLDAIIVVRPGVETLDALPEILGYSDSIKRGYPVLVDIDLMEVACVIDAWPGAKLWQTIRGSDLWQQYFASP